MQTKTLTFLNTLRIGDSFVFQQRSDVWRVIALQDRKGKVAINQVIKGRCIYAHDTLKKGSATVLFLRHTIPVTGEECYMEDLKPGDQFHQPGDMVHTWEVTATGHDFWTVRRLDEAFDGAKAGRLSKVVFVKHKHQPS